MYIETEIAQMNNFTEKSEGRFTYYEAGEGEVLILLHGLFGALSNFYDVIDYFADKMTVSIPVLPLYDLPAEDTKLPGMVEYVAEFINYKGYKKVTILGNSLGGHIALLYALQYPEKIKALILTGSSGLFENSLGDTYPRKSDYEFVKNKTESTFYNPLVATKELVDNVYSIVNDREKAIRILYLAKSALRHNLRDELSQLNIPSLLLWGKNDPITPAAVAEEFKRLLPKARLEYIDKCGHAPMMEHPETFNALLNTFLVENEVII